ncbi:MAG: DNA-binding response regulator [Anaerolineae bacterium]|nr:response regulator transcription factor [Anaerolineales bacterium]MCQ3978724.1 DNA-binding response regulator [Anaerolineae bacterium]
MGKGNPISVILADDHNIVRRGLAALLQMEGHYQVVCEAQNGEEALQCADQTPAQIMILDLSMPRLNGLEAVRRLRHKHPKLKILVLSMYDDQEFVVQALQDGVNGYILKHSMDDELFEALTAISKGQRFVSAAIDLAQIDQQMEPIASPLTSREHEVLQLIAEGHTTTEIAEIMSISPHTANRHRANILQKMGVRNQMELVRLAVKRGLIILKRPPDSLNSSS